MSRQARSGWSAWVAKTRVRHTRGSIAYLAVLVALAVALVVGMIFNLVPDQPAILAMRLLGFAVLWGVLVVHRKQRRRK